MLRFGLTIQPDNLYDTHLQQLIHRRNLVKHLQDPLDGLGHSAVRQEHERIALARRVRLSGEERLNEFGRIGYEVFELLVDGVDGEHRVLAHVRVSVFEAGATEGNEGLEHFDVFRNLLEKTQRGASYVFVWMLLGEREWKI